MIFPMIDVLRGFAALTVVVYHVIELFKWTDFPAQGPLVWFRGGWMGVDLFFVISGFVISLSAFSGIDRAGPLQFRPSFIRHRLARIAPLYYVTGFLFLVFCIPQVFFEGLTWGNLGSHLLFFHNVYWKWHGAIDGANWSLATEMQFYLLILMLAPVLRTARWWAVLAGMLGVAWGWRAASFLLVDTGGPMGTFPLFVTATQLPGMLDEFVCGILLARLVRSERGNALLAYLRRRPWLVLPIAGLAVYGAFAVYWQHASYWDHPLMVICFRSLLGASFALLVLAACVLDSRALLILTTPLRYLGKISYGIYLWHLLVIVSLQRLSWLQGPRALPVVLEVTVLLAMMSWHMLERPMLVRFARGSYQARSVAVEAVPVPEIIGQRPAA